MLVDGNGASRGSRRRGRWLWSRQLLQGVGGEARGVPVVAHHDDACVVRRRRGGARSSGRGAIRARCARSPGTGSALGRSSAAGRMSTSTAPAALVGEVLRRHPLERAAGASSRVSIRGSPLVRRREGHGDAVEGGGRRRVDGGQSGRFRLDPHGAHAETPAVGRRRRVEAHRRQRPRVGVDARGVAGRAVGDVVHGAGRHQPDVAGAEDTVRTSVRSMAAVDEVSVSVPSTTTNAPLAPPWSCRPDRLPGRPTEQPHLVHRRGEQTDPGPLDGVVDDVWTPQLLGLGEAGDDVGEGRHVEAADETVPMAGGCGRARADVGVDMEGSDDGGLREGTGERDVSDR